MMAGGAPGPRPMRWRHAVWLAAIVLFLLNFVRHGIDLSSIVLTAIVVALGFAIEHVETQTRRPLKNYLRVALASFAVGLVLVAMPLLMGSGIWIGLILWSGLSSAALFWCIAYERTEPR
ncbi:hypothetical protein FHR22_003504 [Sphingopyxis panaciterrae]|uniref:hypothetical protein n=1 Tax=Sphingopyxis panaciterrae TaxID=363841 RepID=UPI0014222262|nr:hypothetical protein [Sphingopyxis panaciterrae]NIJ38780.1 hypothetical protein [Sphingopyxis panaciterrae]